MELSSVVVNTRIATAEMTVREVLQECVEQQVSALPFCDAEGHITGSVSVKEVFRFAKLPRDMIKSAHLLGDAIHHLNISSDDIRALLLQPVKDIVEATLPSLTVNSPMVKALVMMESFSTDCLFVMEGGQYAGTVTRSSIARLMLSQ